MAWQLWRHHRDGESLSSAHPLNKECARKQAYTNCVRNFLEKISAHQAVTYEDHTLSYSDVGC